VGDILKDRFDGASRVNPGKCCHQMVSLLLLFCCVHLSFLCVWFCYENYVTMVLSQVSYIHIVSYLNTS